MAVSGRSDVQSVGCCTTNLLRLQMTHFMASVKETHGSENFRTGLHKVQDRCNCLAAPCMKLCRPMAVIPQIRVIRGSENKRERLFVFLVFFVVSDPQRSLAYASGLDCYPVNLVDPVKKNYWRVGLCHIPARNPRWGAVDSQACD